jgi:hypothetical protein
MPSVVVDKASIKEALANCKVKAKEGNPEATTSIFTKTPVDKEKQ